MVRTTRGASCGVVTPPIEASCLYCPIDSRLGANLARRSLRAAAIPEARQRIGLCRGARLDRRQLAGARGVGEDRARQGLEMLLAGDRELRAVARFLDQPQLHQPVEIGAPQR